MTETPESTENSTTHTSEAAAAAAVPAIANPISTELIDIDHFAKVDLRVAEVKEVSLVPKSKKLYKLQVSLGEHGDRQILSGIAKAYTPEELVGRKIIVIANLKPANLMGEESRGMLLAASTEGDAILALLQPSCEIPAGTRVR